jgi:hypothetical protein
MTSHYEENMRDEYEYDPQSNLGMVGHAVHCAQCNAMRKVVAEREPRQSDFDPTVLLELACGHVVM